MAKMPEKKARPAQAYLQFFLATDFQIAEFQIVIRYSKTY